MNARISGALAEVYDLYRDRMPTVDYFTAHDIDINAIAGFCGSPTVLSITLLPNMLFDLPDHGADSVEGVVIEARGEDGETVIDLVAWPVADPSDVRTLLGQSPMVGLSAALDNSTYVLGRPLIMHRTPLAWLQADCEGAAVVVPQLAARVFLEIADIGGRLGAEDFDHARELRRHLDAMTKRVEIVAPKPIRRAA